MDGIAMVTTLKSTAARKTAQSITARAAQRRVFMFEDMISRSYAPSSSPSGAKRGTWSPSALSVAAIGVARNTPGTPQMNHQNNTHTITASGLIFNRPAYPKVDGTLFCSIVMARKLIGASSGGPKPAHVV